MNRVTYFIKGLVIMIPRLWDFKKSVVLTAKYPSVEKKLEAEKDWDKAIKSIVKKYEKKSQR